MSDFDEEKWLAENPRPEAFSIPRAERSQDDIRAIGRWEQKKRRARLFPKKPTRFNEEKWLEENPHPFPDIPHQDLTPEQLLVKKRYILRKSNAKKCADRQGYDDIGRPIKIISEEEAQWIQDNPHPVSGWPERPVSSFSDEERRQHGAWKCRKYKALNWEDIKERIRELDRKRYAADPQKKMAVNKKYYVAHKDEIIAANRERYHANPENYKAQNAACRANRRAAELLRTMDWGNREAIKEIYEIARTVTELTGERHEVDHVIPLQCGNVSGLHVENNLLVLPLSKNRSKGATFTPGQRIPAAGIKKARALLRKVQKEQAQV